MDTGRVFSIKANLGFVLRGSLEDLSAVSDSLEELCEQHNVKIAYKVASASRLRIREDGDSHESC